MTNKLGFLLLILLLCGCFQKKGTNFVKDFLKENQLDKRTTYITYVKSGNQISAETNDSKIAQSFSNYLKEENQNYEIEVDIIEPMRAYVKNSVSNARSQPKHSAELSTQYLMGQELQVLDSLEDWYYVQGPDQYLSWIDAGGVLTAEQVSKEWLSANKKAVQLNELVATEKGNIVTDLVFGNILGHIGGAEYITPQGEKITLQAEAFDKREGQTNIQKALDKAYSLMGRPYLWGGTSTKGMDCSGFTRIAFMNAEYLLGRDASLQVHEGTEVDKDDMSQWKPGDLLFFGNLRDDGSQRITHVAIHTQDGDMIHASQRVRVESMNPNSPVYNEDRANTLLRVKRIL